MLKCPILLESVDVDKEKVLNILRSLDPKKAHDYDDISISMIKIYDSEIVEPLHLIFEKYLDAGVYLISRKRANIIPIRKKTSES